ncbi:MAG: DUF4282 domain-containing protein [Actinomycetaceae bacterium]
MTQNPPDSWGRQPDRPDQPYGGQPGPVPGPQGDPYLTSSTASSTKGFFAKLFDFSFSDYITLTFAKIIYGIVIVVIALAWLTMIVMGFATEPVIGIVALLFGWIPALLYLVIIRVGLEASIALIRTAQNTSDLVRR